MEMLSFLPIIHRWFDFPFFETLLLCSDLPSLAGWITSTPKLSITLKNVSLERNWLHSFLYLIRSRHSRDCSGRLRRLRCFTHGWNLRNELVSLMNNIRGYFRFKKRPIWNGVICGPEGNRTPYSSMPWKHVTGIPRAHFTITIIEYMPTQRYF